MQIKCKRIQAPLLNVLCFQGRRMRSGGSVLEDGVASGFQFASMEAWALADAIRRAAEVYRRPNVRDRLVARAMTREVGWGRAARRYLDPYPGLVAARRWAGLTALDVRRPVRRGALSRITRGLAGKRRTAAAGSPCQL
jgi:hypothetical protein